MLKEYLQNALTLIDELIYLTQEDIDNVGQVSKNDIFSNVTAKNRILQKFDQVKSEIDLQISHLNAQREDASLDSLLDAQEQDDLQNCKRNYLS